ncbi:hypothetical protein [Bacteriovorax sp. DB6_IX]|uniref:hypothetical protein n=2 Tax=Bacteriovorax sp. DB6_IX TaxID=1353530 RepID=UPI00038A49E5|nr:hypothetical protein [Bacteriovorax sp. DB6_IX]EQC51726.1 hypothetical protein M901_0195 [Bacteriovorax sp. DB6_IX]
MKISKLLPIFMLLFLAISCTRVKTINKKEHSFNSYPERLIFLQIPGLSEEHLAYLRYKKPLFRHQTWSESFTCFGKMWRHNLHELRPSVEDSLVSQITGHYGSNKTCDLYAEVPLWSVLEKFNYQSAVVERNRSQGVERALKCNDKFYDESTVFVSSVGTGKLSQEYFHVEREKEYLKNKIYLDESCSKAKCFSKSSSVFFHVWNSLVERPKKLLVFKDYSLINAINSNNSAAFFEYLEELSKLIADINGTIVSRNPNTTLVVSSTSPQRIKWPRSSKTWKGINLAKSTTGEELMAPIWATGAMAENFCGVYSEVDVFNRLFWRPQKTRLPLLDALDF